MNLQQAATINVGHGHPHSQGVNVDDMFHQETGLDDEDDEDDGDGESSRPCCSFNLPPSLSTFCLIPYCTLRYSAISGHFTFGTHQSGYHLFPILG